VNPPQTLPELQIVLVNAKSRSGPISLGKRAIAALEQMIEAPRQTAIYPIHELAENYGTSASTLSRLADRLGYHGFKQFQQVFKDHVTNESGFYSGLAQKMVVSGEETQKNISLLGRVKQKNDQNVDAMCKLLEMNVVARLVDLLVYTPHVRIAGFRQSFSMAGHFSYCLGMLRQNVSMLSAADHGAAHGLAQLSPGDLLLIYGCYPYTRTAISTAHVAKAKGVTVAAITDDKKSPLAAVADYVLIAPTESIFYSNSMVAMLTLNELLLSLSAQVIGESGVRTLRAREKIISAMDAEFGEN
jgi:DNA-binding MurR/RpiR family transcriptional regulator